MAAASATQTGGAPFSAGNVAEAANSDGPRRIFYNADGTAITPGNLLFITNGGTVRNKPDITAADNVSTSLPLSNLNPFTGTSAAAPHAAAIAALIKSIKPSITTAQMRSLLTSTALDIESTGYDNISGYGIVQAFAAMQSLNPTLVADISLGNFTTAEGTGGNGNGGVDPGEQAKLVVNLKNTSPVNATSVAATLTTTSTGVTISTNTFTYGNMSAAASVDNASAPFVFTVASSVTCGTQLNFTLTVSFGNGVAGSQSFPLVVTVGNQPIINIAGALGMPAASTPKYVSSTGMQTGRINRFSPVSVCGTLKTNPGLQSSTGARTYDAYTFTNATSIAQCINATFSSTSGANLYVAAYDKNGFIPATPNVNFLADYGSSLNNESFSFTVSANSQFTLVVDAVAAGGAIGTPYYLNINSNACSNAVLPVTWLSFTAVEKGGQAALEWRVSNNGRANYYEVEHSTDGNNFTKIFTIPAGTNTATEQVYDQLHPFPAQGKNYYRIREVDIDGQSTYSKTVLLNLDKVNTITVAPTIASSFVLVQSKSIINGIRLYNSAGQLLMNLTPATTSFSLPVNNLPTGPYFLQITTATEMVQKKIIKN